MAESNTAEKKNEVEPSKGKEGEADAANGSNGCDDEPPLTEDDLKAVENVKDRLKFFFSDANLRQDRFMRKLLMNEEDDEGDGHYSPLSVRSITVESLLSFNTIKRHTNKPAVIIKAAKELSDILIISNNDNDNASSEKKNEENDDNKNKPSIGRVVPFTRSMMGDFIPKSLYVKNLPLKDEGGEGKPKSYAVTRDDLKALFEKFGEISFVKMKFSIVPNGDSSEDATGEETGKKSSGRNNHKKRRKHHPTGAAMIEFATMESLQKAADATLTIKDGEKLPDGPKEKLFVGDPKVQVDVMLYSEYDEKKNKDRGQYKKRNRGGDDEDDNNNNDNDDKELPTFTLDWKPGCVIKLKGLSSNCQREDILASVAKGLNISVDDVMEQKIYADFSRGQTDGAIRFREPCDEVASLSNQLKDGTVFISDKKVDDVYVLEGDDEAKYWNDFIAFKTKQLQHREEEKRNRAKARKKQKR